MAKQKPVQEDTNDKTPHPAQEFLNTHLYNTLFQAVDREGFDTNSVTVEQFIASSGELDKMTAAQIAHLYSHLKAEFDKLDEVRDTLSKFVELIKCVKLPEAFEREDIKTFTLRDGTRVTTSQRVLASIPADKKFDAYQWLRENDMDQLIVETVNASTLSAFAKNVLEGGMAEQDVHDLPADLFKVEIRPTTAVTRGKAKK